MAPTVKSNAIEMSCLIIYVLCAIVLLYASPVVFSSLIVGAFTFKALQDINERRLLYPAFLEAIPSGMGISSMEVTTVIPCVIYHLHATYAGESHHFEGEFVSLIQQMHSFRSLHKI